MVARRSDTTLEGSGTATSLERALQKRDLEVEELENRIAELEAAGGEFLSNATHAVRTPLTVILSYLEILQADLTAGLGDEQLSFLGVVWDNAVKLRELIDDLAELAALETKTAQLDKAPHDLAILIDEVLTDIAPALSRSKLQTTLNIGRELPRVRVDPAAFKSIINRLMDNAIQFTPTDGEINLRTDRINDHVVIEVADTGAGIAAEHIAEAFRPFSQLHRKPGRPRTGYGLGLPIARRLAEAFGGTLEAKSEVGEGTTFRICLPIHTEET